MSKKKRAKNVERAVREVADSLLSHLPHCYGKSEASHKHHKKCVKSYAKLLVVLAHLY